MHDVIANKLLESRKIFLKKIVSESDWKSAK